MKRDSFVRSVASRKGELLDMIAFFEVFGIFSNTLLVANAGNPGWGECNWPCPETGINSLACRRHSYLLGVGALGAPTPPSWPACSAWPGGCFVLVFGLLLVGVAQGF